MDKAIILAVAGSGKTTHIVNSLSKQKRSLIVTYTTNNYKNIENKISQKFNGGWPESIVVMTYFTFLYRFCYKPFLSDVIGAKGITYEPNTNQYSKKKELSYYISAKGYIYSNRLALLLEKLKCLEDIKTRLKKYFDELIIDEVQDIAGRDFDFLEQLMDTKINMLFVGDFYQHTYDTSRDGNVNKSLFDDYSSYISRFTKRGFSCDSISLSNSWRCSKNICEYITQNLGIDIFSNRDEANNKEILLVTEPEEISRIMDDRSIVKLHYQNSSKFGKDHRNWGDTKGEDCYYDVCVMLNKNTAKQFAAGKLGELKPITKNKLYVAITRAYGNVYFIYDEANSARNR